ncbi:MAG: RagB/SusD family nutrient uptake outer membrane protein [Marinilabiliaceae bacterium]|nr:RagB/SusD family nutrient uptake outer membrane protein [Marinilabiliaceae bacterium]
MKKNILFILVSVFILTSCEDLFEPAIENHKELDLMYTDPIFAQGILTSAYRHLTNCYSNTEYATDDAVTNDKNSSFLDMATGSWTASFNPVSAWENGYASIQYVNTFLENCDSVHWADDPEAAALFKMRMKGEAYGLRGVYLYYILRNHAGYSPNGELLGVPILTKFQDIDADFNIPRASFQACVQQIINDLDSAITYLPVEYKDAANLNEIPAKYQGMVSFASTYNRTMGNYFKQLLNAHIAMAFRSKVALLAASSAYQDASNTTTWEDAAKYSADVLNHINGTSGLAANGLTYYTNTADLDNLKEGNNPAEIIWRTNISKTSSSEESNNLPPSLSGKGRMNPTQNLVNAFPDRNGYPITHSSSTYNNADPFANRDPRLSNYIVYNGNSLGVSGSPIIINTGSDSDTDDGINKRETSTRTGYYMKKRLRNDVNYDNASKKWQEKNNYIPRIRYTEIFLNYAEAANEAYGPSGTAQNATYSAYDVIKAIRARAGVGLLNGDAYLEECNGDKNKMRELIRNERRIELCFEDSRFWDLRRWGVDLTETAKGYDASTGQVFDVEPRSYTEYMNYGPIPYSETLKYDKLIQNKGW